MPSRLRLESTFEPVSVNATYQTSPTLRPAKKQKMSLTQTYYVASTARSKLGKEASRADHNLRLLVGHANLLDSLMLELADAEREQEAWFNQSVKKASKPEESRHIQWIDTIAEESMEEDSDSESDSDSEYDEDMEEIFTIPVRRISAPPVEVSSAEIEENYASDEDLEFDDDDDEERRLTRVASNHSPPELLHDSDSDSEEDECQSPEQPALALNDKQRQAIASTAFYDVKTRQGLEGYIMEHTQHQPQAPIIAAY